jgi:ABC-type nitrate/sulfonate/bicarbonate transport system ATPase subunit
VIAVSYSAFDKFNIPSKSDSFNYTYCGIRNRDGKISTDRGLRQRFHNSWKKISDLERMNDWVEILEQFIPIELLKQFLNHNPKDGYHSVDLDGFGKVNKQLSSGESILLYIITEIIANIRFDSLLLFDEPETHLHPNAITELMNVINSIVERFESYCIITTHSPLVIREIFSRNVYIIEKEDSYVSLRRIGIESFGQNISVLTDEVFQNRDVQKNYKRIIANMVNRGFSYKKILKKIQFDEQPLSNNAKIYIKSLIANRNEES